MEKTADANAEQSSTKIIIIGGGFGGVRCALDLVKKNLPNTKITLINDRSHFEYTPGLYRVISGHSPLEVCIPLRDIFKKTRVAILHDTIIKADLKKKTLQGESQSTYSYDYLVLALGSTTNYFNVPGLEGNVFGFKSIHDALKLKRHLHQLFTACQPLSDSKKKELLNISVVGGGASGTELAGELALFTKKMAYVHQVKHQLITINIIEAGPRLLATLPENFAQRSTERLKRLKVNIILDNSVSKKKNNILYLKDKKIETNTVIWTAGTRLNHLYSKIAGLQFGEQGRVIVDSYLQAAGRTDVFVLGDAANTPFAGLAQTAIHNGQYVASLINRRCQSRSIIPYQATPPQHALPIGSGWAAVIINDLQLFGRLGWLIRRTADLNFFLSILPIHKTWLAWRSGTKLTSNCPTCAQHQHLDHK